MSSQNKPSKTLIRVEGGYPLINFAMEDNFPISNIPLIFTQYRTRILEESGQEWFHSDNNSDEDTALAKDTALEKGTALEKDAAPEKDTEPLVLPSHPIVKEGAPSVKTTRDEHLDPPASSPPDVDIVLPILHSAQPLSTEPAPPDNQNAEQTSEQPATTVNLFPFEPVQDDQPDITGIYDLTEFDNGEIEVPPVAIRSAQPAKFEKVSRPSAAKPDPQDEHDILSLNDPNALEAIDPTTLSSAELAKYRLRKCL